MSVTLSPSPWEQFFDNTTGAPLAGGLLYTFAAGSTTPIVTFKDSSSSANTNPIQLDAHGRAVIYLTPGTAYKYVLTDSLGNAIQTQDNILGVSSAIVIAGVAGQLAEYAANGTDIQANGTATVIQGGTGATSFTAHGVLIGEGTTAVASTAAMTTGQLLVGVTSSDPVPSNASAAGASVVLLKANSGTDTSAGATNVDTIATGPLTVKDTLRIEIDITSVTQPVAGMALFSTTDTTSLGTFTSAPTTAGETVCYELRLGVGQAAATEYHLLTYGRGTVLGAQGTILVTTGLTAWTTGFTLALRHLGVTAGGTLQWRWKVTKLVGQ